VSANFLANYYKVLKLNEAYPLPKLLEFAFLSFFWPPFVPVNLPALTTLVLHFYPISSRYLTIFVHFYEVLRYFLCCYTSSSPSGFHFTRFSFYTSTFFLWHAVSHSYNVMVSFAFFVFVRHTAHCFLLLVSCRSWMSGKVDQAEHQVVV